MDQTRHIASDRVTPSSGETQGSASGPADADLMVNLAAGRIEALAQLVVRHQDRVRTLAYRMTGNWDAADDVCQEAFLRVYRSANAYRPDAAFTTWLYRVVVNLCLDRAKRRWWPALAGREPAGSTEPADASLLEQERGDAVRRAVSRLPDRQRVALVLHRFQGQSHGEIARTTGWSESAVESLLVRAYAQLRRELKEWDDSR